MREWEEGGVACEEMKKEEGAVAVSVAVGCCKCREEGSLSTCSLCCCACIGVVTLCLCVFCVCRGVEL